MFTAEGLKPVMTCPECEKDCYCQTMTDIGLMCGCCYAEYSGRDVACVKKDKEEATKK